MIVSVLSAAADRAAALTDRLRRAGLSIGNLRSAADVVIVDVAVEAAEARALAHEIATQGRADAVLAATQLPPLAPAQAAGFDGVIDLGLCDAAMRRRIDLLRRASLAKREAALRAETAAALGRPLRAASEPQAPHALLVGAPAPDLLALEHHLTGRGVFCEAALTPGAGFERLHGAPFDALILNARGGADFVLTLSGALRCNAGLRDMPTMALVDAPDQGSEAIRRGVERVLAPRGDGERAAIWLLEDIRRYRDEQAARRRLDAFASGGLATPELFLAHAERLGAAAERSGRALAVNAVRVAAPPGSKARSPASWRRTMLEVGGLFARLGRSVDLTAIFEPDLIVRVLPGETQGGARSAAARSAAVGECTVFGAERGGSGLLLFEPVGLEWGKGETALAVFSRVRDLFKRAAVA